MSDWLRWASIGGGGGVSPSPNDFNNPLTFLYLLLDFFFLGIEGPTSINRFSALSSTSTPATSGSSTPTRIQRKNANTAAKKAAAKEVEERDRLERLTKYRKEQER